MEEISIVPIHHHPEYLKQCCELLNDEWPRSDAARMHGLKVSRDHLPTCLVLLLAGDVVGHCKLSRIPSIPDSCFLESVVIKKSLRGRKLGTELMRRTEHYCREFLHLSKLHLSTRGQEAFYKKLGYTECEPVSIYGGMLGINTPRPSNVINNNSATVGCNYILEHSPSNAAKISSQDSQENASLAGPPPPPPLPKPSLPRKGKIENKTSKIYMTKDL